MLNRPNERGRNLVQLEQARARSGCWCWCCLEVKLLGLLPRELGSAKVTTSSGSQVLGLLQAEVLDNDTGTQVEVAADDLDELLVRLLTGTVGVDEDGKRVGHTNRVRELHEDATSKASSDERLGNPSRSVGGGSVDLGEVLAGESSTTVRTPTTVGVDNDLSASQTGVTLGTTNDEAARGLNVVDGVVVEQVGGNHLLDDFFHDLGSELLSRDLLGVLGRDDDRVNTERDGGTAILLVLDSDLGLGVGSEPSERTVAAGGSHGQVELVREHEGQGHQLGRLVGSVAEHDTLVTGSVVLERAMVKTLGDIGRLLLDGDEHVAGLVVETLLRRVVADLLDRVTDDLLVVDLSLGRDLTKDHDHTGLGGSLTGDLGVGVLLEAGVLCKRKIKQDEAATRRLSVVWRMNKYFWSLDVDSG